MVSRDGAPLYPLRDVRTLDAARGTIVFLDWRWLRGRNGYDRYVSKIQPALRNPLLAVTAGDWVPVELLLAHYRALDAMDLTREETVACGVSVGEGLHGSMLRTLVKLASHFGATPWAALGQAPKLWTRSYRGGGFLVARLADTSARVEVVKTPAARSAFHRGSVAGVISVGIGWLCKQHVIRELQGQRTEESFALQVDWT